MTITRFFFHCQITGPCGYVPKGVCVAQQTGRSVKCFTTSSELPSASATRGQTITTPSSLSIDLSRFERLKDMNERVYLKELRLLDRRKKNRFDRREFYFGSASVWEVDILHIYKKIFVMVYSHFCDAQNSLQTFPEQLTSVKVKKYKPIRLYSKVREKSNKKKYSL